jgi:hypothetical protein
MKFSKTSNIDPLFILTPIFHRSHQGSPIVVVHFIDFMPQKLLIIKLKPVSGQVLVIAYHKAIYAVKAHWTEFIFVLFIVLLVVALFMKDMGAVVTYHSFVIGNRMVAKIAYQIADVTMKLYNILSYD